MVKNWLIRTKNNHILGPVSKQKIKELISNGSIKGDDEICSGNGYWIYVREQDLVAKYILSDEEQGFNPVQEAEPTFALSPLAADLEYPPSGDDLFPDEDDLAYPSVGESQADITKIGMSLGDLQSQIEDYQPELNESDELDQSSKKKVKVTDSLSAPKLKKRKQKAVPKAQVKKSLLEGRILLIATLVLFLIAIYLLLNRSTFIKQVIENSDIPSLVPNSYAQVLDGATAKKKSGLNP